MEDLKEKVSYLGRSNGMKSSVGVVHLVAFSVAFGMSMWMTFVSTYILEGVLPRQQFGRLQSKIYPVYFKVQAYSVAAVFLVHLVGRKSLFVINSWELFHVINILVALLMSLVNLLYLEPRAAELKNKMQMLTVGIGGIGLISAYVSYTPEITASYGVGFLGSLAYMRMLGNSVDSMADGARGLLKGAIGQPRLLVPVVLVMIYNRWNGILVPEYGIMHLELIPILVGFFTYKIATFTQAIEEALTVVGKKSQV